MKANNGIGNTELRDEWQTPNWIFEPLMQQYNFDFDCCATKENTKTKEFSEHDFQDIMELNKIAWMNPPFSKAEAMFKHFFKIVKKGVAIYRCDNLETGIWQNIIFPHADWVFFPNHRVNYEGLDGSGVRFPSALIGIGVSVPKQIQGCVVNKC